MKYSSLIGFYAMKIEKIERMDLLIRTKSTGKPEEFARKLGLSPRSLFNYINFMRDHLGAPIEFSKEDESYYYTKNGGLKIGWYRSNGQE